MARVSLANTHRKLPLLSFLASWLALLFATFLSSTDSYEPSALVGLLPFYFVSLAFFCIFFASWRGKLLYLAILSAFYQVSVAGLPYLKYPILYGNVFDTMFHYSLTQTILSTGHVANSSAYFGFTTFHSSAAIISITSGLDIVTVLKFELFILPALVQLAGFWITTEVLRRRSTAKLAILGAIIAFTFNFTSAPQVMAAFLVVLSIALVLPFARSDPALQRNGYTASLLLLLLAIVITHHQTAFFTIVALIGIGLLLPITKSFMKTAAVSVQRIELVGLLALGFAYIWWTYYAGFTDLLRNVFSIITGEPLQFQTTVGRGVFYYGPITWAYRTLIHYAQRGQLLVWTTIGILVSVLTLTFRRKSDAFDTDTHAIVLTCILLFLGVYAVFLFVPFFVIGSDRFFRFISFVSPPFIALGIEAVYSLSKRVGTKINFRLGTFLHHPVFHAAVTFLLLVFIFVELTSPLLLGEVYAASSRYEYSQITFVAHHAHNGTTVISHLAITNQLQVYAPNYPRSSVEKVDSVSVLFTLYSTNMIPVDIYNTPILVQRIGPAGVYFEALSYYSNATWVSPTLMELLALKGTSVLYNSGEAFIVLEA